MCSMVFEFMLRWTEIIERRVRALTVIEDLDVVKDGSFGLLAGIEGAVMDHLILEV